MLLFTVLLFSFTKHINFCNLWRCSVVLIWTKCLITGLNPVKCNLNKTVPKRNSATRISFCSRRKDGNKENNKISKAKKKKIKGNRQWDALNFCKPTTTHTSAARLDIKLKNSYSGCRLPTAPWTSLAFTQHFVFNWI